MTPTLLSPFAAVLVLAAAGCSSTAAPTARGPAPEDGARRFRFVYEAAVRDVPPAAERVRLWIPVPVDTPEQRIGDVEVVARTSSPAGPVEARLDLDAVAEHGAPGDALRLVRRPVRGGSGDSLLVETDGRPVEVELAFDVVRRPASPGGDATPAELAEALEPDALIPLDGRVGRVAASLPTGDDPVDTARALYEHTLERMRYEKPAGGGWGRGDAEWACDNGYGNCTDFHSYFLGLARAKGVPARFEMGFPVPGGDDPVAEIGGYHCWAWFWGGEDEGWVPVDVSEADKDPRRAEYFFGSLDADRVTMTGGRDLLLDPAPEAGALNFFVYPHAEIDGRVVEAEREFRRHVGRAPSLGGSPPAPPPSGADARPPAERSPAGAPAPDAR